MILYDNFDPQRRVARSAAEYGSFFEKAFNDIKVAEHAIEEAPNVVVTGDLAAARFVFIARLTGPDGAVTANRATTSQVWRYSADGRWRIVREHTSVDQIPVAEADEAMLTLPRS